MNKKYPLKIMHINSPLSIWLKGLYLMLISTIFSAPLVHDHRPIFPLAPVVFLRNVSSNALRDVSPNNHLQSNENHHLNTVLVALEHQLLHQIEPVVNTTRLVFNCDYHKTRCYPHQ